jgi:hypothetical protein
MPTKRAHLALPDDLRADDNRRMNGPETCAYLSSTLAICGIRKQNQVLSRKNGVSLSR